MRRVAGFTLLELLVAMSIFAIIGLGANQMLRTILQTHELAQAKIESLSAYTRALAVMQRDFNQLVYRRVRDEYGEVLPALRLNSGPYPVEFSRTGWNNPLGLPRSNLQRVAYELTDDGKLKRHFWLVMDRAEDSKTVEQILLENISDFRISLLDENGFASDVWPDPNNPDQTPIAAEVLLETKLIGELRQIFSFVEVANTNVFGSAGNTGNGRNLEDDEDIESEDLESGAETEAKGSTP